MQQVLVGTNQTLLAPAGNRDFLAIYNNGSGTVYLCFDGDDGISTPPIVTTPLDRWFGTPVVTYRSISASQAGGISVGQLHSGANIPSNVYVTSIVPLVNQNPGNGPITVNVTPFTALGDSSGTYTFGQTALTANNGFPLPPGTWMNLDNSTFRNVLTHAIYAISASGTNDVRIQGD